MIKKENITWIFIWLLCVYINGANDIANLEIPLLKRIIDPLLFGSGIFLVIYFAWTRRFHMPKETKTVAKGTALLMLISAVLVLILYFLGVIKPIIFIISAAVWFLIVRMILKPTK